MLRFLAARIAMLVAALAAAALVIFLVLEILPGDPAAAMLGVSATPETIAALRAELGLDQPAARRFLRWLAGLVTGDLGLSYAYRVPVGGLIGERFGVTLPLAVLAMLLAAGIGIPLGVAAASRANTRLDAVLMGVSQLGLAIPNFWFGLLFVLIFSIGLGWFPSGGFPGWSAGPGPALHALILPALALALPMAAVLARITRSAVIEALGEDYILTARAKGLSRAEALVRHALRNALIPVVTILGLQFSFLLTGTVVVEGVFALPGLGRLLIQAIGGHDLMLIRSLVLMFAGAAMAVNALVDIAYGLLDPRMRPA
ncbi:MAG: ABC transporter permease [Hyphomicrobiales bacterium]|nr:ABC transporter permease [Hyphomicrobiales bacterium]MCA1999653.1 ABC transporter permease [Hyphomicrobiales bacterium]